MSGRNWTANRRRITMDRNGTRWAGQQDGIMTPLLRRRRRRPPGPSKADMRTETEQFVADFMKAKG